MSDFYPLIFQPIFKEKIWGGNRIKTILGKDFGQLKNCGESWEISAVKGNISIVDNGPLKGKPLDEIIASDPEGFLGKKIAAQSIEFPLLIKFLDADDDLSIQVHPNDELAKKKHNGFGKTEMWYIINAEPGSELISGFSRSTNKKEFIQTCKEGKLMGLLNREKVSGGDTFFIPSGRIHSIGKGILLTEIQQTSDITYRIFDFDRLGTDGTPRELHLADAVDALDFNLFPSYCSKYDHQANQATLVKSTYFTTCRIKGENKIVRELKEVDSFHIYIIVDGVATLSWNSSSMEIQKGDVILVPFGLKKYSIFTDAKFCGLEVFIS